MRRDCALLRRKDRSLIIDSDTGIQRLIERPELLHGVEDADLPLTHFHLDHVVGLAYLPALSLPVPPRVLAPGRARYGQDSRGVLCRLLGPPLLSADLARLWREVVEVGPGTAETAIGEVVLRRQDRHSCPTLALRVGSQLAYCTDTAYDEGTIEFASGVGVLVHEAWWSARRPSDTQVHTSGAQAGQIAARAGCDALVLIHVHPVGGRADVLAEARDVFENTVLGTDLQRIIWPPPARLSPGRIRCHPPPRNRCAELKPDIGIGQRPACGPAGRLGLGSGRLGLRSASLQLHAGAYGRRIGGGGTTGIVFCMPVVR